MKTLVLNSNYKPIAFVNTVKAIGYILKGKVEVISNWDSKLYWSNGDMYIPSIVRLKYYVRWVPKTGCSRSGIFKRDGNVCQYCGQYFHPSCLTIDHIVPKSAGGKLSWTNAVVSCWYCNSKKADKLLEKCGLKLLNKPVAPNSLIYYEYTSIKNSHKDWSDYLYKFL
jgi:hypothetical protein